MNKKMSITDVCVLIYEELSRPARMPRMTNAQIAEASGYTEASIRHMIRSGMYRREYRLESMVTSGGRTLNDVGESEIAVAQQDVVSEEYADVMNLGSFDDDNYYLDDREDGDPEELNFHDS